MNTNDTARETVMLNISRLMLIFLPLSMIANYYHQRYAFSILYLFSFVATLVHLWCYARSQDLDQAAEKIMIILFGLFATFFIIGEQRTFDILWVLVLPMVGVMLTSFERIRFWLILFNALLVIMLILGYLKPAWLHYETFALWSMLWAGIFVSGLALYYKTSQEHLEAKIRQYQSGLQSKIDEAVREIEALNEDLDATQAEILQRLGTLGEYRSKETGAHVRRVGLYTRKLALLSGVDSGEAELFERAAPLHDIGKVGIEDAILHKPGKLTDAEYTRMKEHPIIGESILSGSDKPLLQCAAEIAGGHHEKYDGSGYPRGRSGESIPLSARIVAIADVFDALYSQRVYKESWDLESIKTFFTLQSGAHFDPYLAALFLQHIDQFVLIYEENR